MSRKVLPRTSIASNRALSSILDILTGSDFEKGVLLGEHVVLNGGRRPVWKYSRTTFAVQREGDDQDVCYQEKSVSNPGNSNKTQEGAYAYTF